MAAIVKPVTESVYTNGPTVVLVPVWVSPFDGDDPKVKMAELALACGTAIPNASKAVAA